LKGRISLLDKTGSSEVFEKNGMDRRMSIRKGFRHEPSKQALINSPVKSDLLPSATFGEVVDDETKPKLLKDNSSTLLLETTHKKMETTASPTNKKHTEMTMASPTNKKHTETVFSPTNKKQQFTPLLTESTLKSFNSRRAKSSLRARVEKSILEAEEFLKNEPLEIDNPFVGNILKKYAVN
jgi:hypothetical protein